MAFFQSLLENFLIERYMQISRSNFMHFMRWVAAFLVVISHIRSVVFEDFKLLKSSGVLIKLFYLITSLGHESVVVFFVLSGYLIGQSVINQVKIDNFRFSSYLVNRFSRLYVVLIVALIFTFLFDKAGVYFDKIGLYNNGINIPALNYSVIDRESLGHFLASLFMLQNIVLPPLGSNSPLWSLNCEFWYYLLFPVLYIPSYFALNNRIHGFIYKYIIIAILIMAFLPWEILKYFSLWIVGLIPIYVHINNKIVKYLFGFAFLLVLGVSILHIPLIEGIYIDFILALLFSFWLSTFWNYIDIKTRLYKFNEKLASFSYTVYLIHMPLLLCIISIINSFLGVGVKNHFNTYSLFVFVLVLTAVYSFSYILAFFTEFKTKEFKLLLQKLIPQNAIARV